MRLQKGGLLLFFMPVMGFVAGAFLLDIRRFRFVAPYAFLTPVCSSYSATAGLWGSRWEWNIWDFAAGRPAFEPSSASHSAV